MALESRSTRKEMTDSPKRRDRRDTPLGMTRSVCPECRQLVDAHIVERRGRVVMRSWCPDHGWTEALVSSDAQQYRDARRFARPGSMPIHVERDFHGCPDSCGLCPEHEQHTCLALMEITQACQLDCPVCFAGPSAGGGHLSLAQIDAMMERLLACEGEPESLQLSGGEPTLHPQIIEVLRLAEGKGFRRILLNTNGVRLAEDPAFLDAVAEFDPTIYLQFDGLEDATYETLRGRALVDLKLRLVDMLAERELRTVLVATVVRGVNEHELGALVDFALAQRHVRCLTLQPATYAGRFGPALPVAATDPMDRVTLADCARMIAAQSRHGFKKTDFFPIPCPDPACSLVTYVHTGADPETGEERVLPLTRLADAEDYVDFVKNASAGELNGELREVFDEFIAAGAAADRTAACSCSSCGGVSVDWGALELEITLIGMMHFMDEHTFDLSRLRKCCVHEVLPDDGGIVPFCAYNVLHRGR